MSCENVKVFCDRFNEIINKYPDDWSQEEGNFVDTWEIALMKSLILDFGKETVADIGHAVSELYS